MTTETSQITISGMPVSIVRKSIKNLHLGVYPPNGRVRVAAPLAVSDDAVRRAVISRLGWIKRQLARFSAQLREPVREMVNGESHYFLGHRYRLRVVADQGPGRVVLRGRTVVELHVRPDADTEARRQLLHAWYRERLRELIPKLVDKWQTRLGVRAADWRIRQMKTKWGSCNPDARRIWLNLELAKKPVRCLEYIVVHELLHLRARRHDARFLALMDKHLPGWQQRRRELNAAPLAHERWSY